MCRLLTLTCTPRGKQRRGHSNSNEHIGLMARREATHSIKTLASTQLSRQMQLYTRTPWLTGTHNYTPTLMHAHSDEAINLQAVWQHSLPSCVGNCAHCGRRDPRYPATGRPHIPSEIVVPRLSTAIDHPWTTSRHGKDARRHVAS